MNAQPFRYLSGSCLCARVRYRVEDAFAYALYCHCSKCRRATGSAFKALAAIERTKLAITQGAEHLRIFGQELNHDARCGICSSLLYSLVREGQFVHITMGTLGEAPSIRPSAHIFVGSKAPWFTITDDLPQHLEFG